jgi:hypothetical protein
MILKTCTILGHKFMPLVNFAMVDIKTTVAPDGQTSVKEKEILYAKGKECARCKERHAERYHHEHDVRLEILIQQWKENTLPNEYEELMPVESSADPYGEPTSAVFYDSDSQLLGEVPLVGGQVSAVSAPKLRLVVNKK